MITVVCLLFVMVSGYAAFTTNLSITATGNIKEPSKVIQSFGEYSNEDFHSEYYKENIVSATFLDTAVVPDNAVDSFNVSDDKEHGGVMAWVVPNAKDNTKYDLYIRADGGVIANPDSSYLFYDMYALKTIDFNDNFDTSNATNMECMFAQTSSLNGLDLSSFDTSSVTTANSMFFSTNVSTLNLCNFDTSNITNMSSMFKETKNFKNVYVGSNWTSAQADTTDMFLGSSISEVTTGMC